MKVNRVPFQQNICPMVAGSFIFTQNIYPTYLPVIQKISQKFLKWFAIFSPTSQGTCGVLSQGIKPDLGNDDSLREGAHKILEERGDRMTKLIEVRQEQLRIDVKLCSWRMK